MSKGVSWTWNCSTTSNGAGFRYVTVFSWSISLISIFLRRSWTYSIKFLDMSTTQTRAEMSSYIINGEWEVLDVPVQRNELKYQCCPEPYADITVTIHMKRKVLYYIFNLIIPTTMIVTFILVGFCLPPITGERVTLNITVLLTMTVFLNIASNTLPSTSDATPLLGDYYLILMIQNCFAILATVFVLRYYYAGPVRMPKIWRVIINEWIASCLFFVITKKPKGKGISQWCGKQSEDACFDCEETRHSYIVHNENNAIEEHIALIETTPKNTIPRVNGNLDRSQRAPRSSSPTKWKSEPAITVSDESSRARTSGGQTRRRKPPLTSKRSNNLNTVQNRIIEGLGVLTRRVKDENDKGDVAEEWEFAAIVLDRLFFALFFLSSLAPLMVFFFTAPPSKPSLVEPKNWQQLFQWMPCSFSLRIRVDIQQRTHQIVKYRVLYHFLLFLCCTLRKDVGGPMMSNRYKIPVTLFSNFKTRGASLRGFPLSQIMMQNKADESMWFWSRVQQNTWQYLLQIGD